MNFPLVVGSLLVMFQLADFADVLNTGDLRGYTRGEFLAKHALCSALAFSLLTCGL